MDVELTVRFRHPPTDEEYEKLRRFLDAVFHADLTYAEEEGPTGNVWWLSPATGKLVKAPS